jgi:hypothetical protein
MQMKANDVLELRRNVTEALWEVSVTGATGRDIQRDIQQRVTGTLDEGLSSWRFIDVAGRKWDTGNYFNMLTRTVTREVAQVAYVDALTSEGFDLCTIEGGGSPCPVCEAWRGVVVSLSGTNQDYPALSDARREGVFHPNCCCEPVYIDETVGKDTLDRQAGMDKPSDPSAGDWTDYARQVRKEGNQRDFAPADELSAALDEEAA